MTSIINNEKILAVLLQTLAFSRNNNYIGWDKHDGMNSKIVELIPIKSKWINFIFQEAVKRSPVNVRSLLLINQERSFKGAALFASTYFNLYELLGESRYRNEGVLLVNWLIDNASKGYSGFCGGHRHPRQQRDRFVPANTPAIVPTYFAVDALLKAYKHNKKLIYLEKAISSIDFIKTDLEYLEKDNYARIKYKPGDRDGSITLNANALGARLLIHVYKYTKDEVLTEMARKILSNIVSEQSQSGGWMYTAPSKASHLAMDNYHNGFIIESLLEYQYYTNNHCFDNAIHKAVGFYRTRLFNSDGSPNWDNTKDFPKDIHACAEGILLFSLLNEKEFALKIIQWTLKNLYNEDGMFYYQKSKKSIKKIVLMRWGQAWMSFALSTYLNRFK